MTDSTPAFPLMGGDRHEGMTLRDWFAGQALIKITGHLDAHTTREKLAADTYKWADAMMTAREQ